MASKLPASGQRAAAHLAARIVASRGQAIAASTRAAALRCLFDLIVAAAAGSRDRSALSVRRAAPSIAGEGSSPLWFTGGTTSVIGAAFANSAAASAQDLDDGHRLARGHPGAVVVPVALAVGRSLGSSSEETIAAIVAGYEVGVAIASARTSYGNTGTWGAYAAVATAAVLRGTPADIVEHALAIAGESAPNQLFSSAPPPRDPDPEGSDVKEGIPWSVMTGLAALSLAEAGHTGPRNILDSARHFDLPRILNRPARPHIESTYFKLYACCRHVHAPLDALREVIGQHDLAAGQIDTIEVATTSGALRIANRTRPANLIDVQYSIPYCLALAALKGPSSLLPLTEDVLHQSDVEALATRVSLRLDPEFDARFPAETLCRVTVIAGDRQLVSSVTAPKGEASDPLSWNELRAKARAVTRLDASPRLADLLDALAQSLEAGTVPDLDEILLEPR